MRGIAAAVALGLGLAAALPAVAEEGTAGPPPLPAEEEEKGTLDQRFFRAFYEEQGVRDFEKAARLFAEVADAARTAGNADLHGQALLGRGRCLRALGRIEEARAAFGEALEADPGNGEARAALAQAGEEEVGIETELQARIEALVWKLGGPEREQAQTDLHRIGARAIPFLESGLRTADVGVVESAANLLARMPARGARGALARAVGDPAIPFPELILGAVAGVRGDYEADREGLYDLLRAAAAAPAATRLRLYDILNSRFRMAPAGELVPVLEEILEDAGDEEKERLLRGNWGPSTGALLPAAVAFLRSEDPARRTAALQTVERAGDPGPEALAAVRSALDGLAPEVQVRAFLLLETRGALEEGDRAALVNRFLGSSDPSQANPILSWLWPKDGPARWAPAYAPGFAEGIRKGIAVASADNGSRAMALGYRLSLTGTDLSMEDLVDLLSRFGGERPTNRVSALPPSLLKAAFARYVGVEDPAVLGPAFLLGLRRLEGQQLRDWVSSWHDWRLHLPPEALAALVEEGPSYTVRSPGYDWILRRPEASRPDPTPVFLDRLGEDLRHAAGNWSTPVFQLALSRPDPRLAAPLRILLGDITNSDHRYQYLGLLVRCAGRGAIPDLRAELEKSDLRSVLDMLLELAGAEAVADLRAYIARHPEGEGRRDLDLLPKLVELAGRDAAEDLRECVERTGNETALSHLLRLVGKEALPTLRAHLRKTASYYARDRLVEYLGTEAAPDLVAAVLENDRDPRILLCNGAWNDPPIPQHVGLPPGVATAYFEAFPEEKRTGPLFEQVAFVLPEGKRLACVNGYLSDPRPEMVAAAARVVRRFNMVEFWPRLLPLLDAPDETVRTRAREALDAIREYRSLKESFERYGVEGAKKALDDAMALAEDGDPVKRRGAALAIGALGDPGGVPTLLRLLDDGDAAVKEAALAALERLGGR